LITARYFSAYPSDSISRWTPCPPECCKERLQVHLGCIQLSLSCPFRLLHTFSLLRPARHYSRFWIRRSSFERRRDFNPPEQCAAQRTLPRCPTPRRHACGPYGLGLLPPPCGLFHHRHPRGLPVLVHEVSRRALGSSTTQDCPQTRVIVSVHVAFRVSKRVGVLIASFRSSIPSPPMPLFTLRLAPHGT
jgi:hypothetical protein